MAKKSNGKAGVNVPVEGAVEQPVDEEVEVEQPVGEIPSRLDGVEIIDSSGGLTWQFRDLQSVDQLAILDAVDIGRLKVKDRGVPVAATAIVEKLRKWDANKIASFRRLKHPNIPAYLADPGQQKIAQAVDGVMSKVGDKLTSEEKVELARLEYAARRATAKQVEPQDMIRLGELRKKAGLVNEKEAE